MLELKKRNIAELPFEVLEQAYWRPSEAQLCCKYRPANIVEKEFRRLRRMWRSREVNVNFALDSLLMCCTPTEMAKLASGLLGGSFNDALLFGGYSMALKKIIGVPDLVISDGINCIIGEIKLLAGYELGQFTKYQTFAMLCRASAKLPSNICHVIITPQAELNKFVSDFGKNWTPYLDGLDLNLVEADKLNLLSAMTDNVSLLGGKLKLAKGLSAPSVLTVDSLLAESQTITPTKVYSWTNFEEIFKATTRRSDLDTPSRTLTQLATGIFSIDAEC